MNYNTVQERSKNLPKELNEFNWGAFLFTSVWGLKYNIVISIITILLITIQIPFFINWFILLIFKLYCGVNGNQWAYRIDNWMNSTDFKINQMKWATLGLSLTIILACTLLSITLTFLKKDDSNSTKIIQNSLCKNSYNKLRQDFKKISISEYETSNDIAQKLLRINTNSKLETNILTLNKNKHNNPLSSYIITIQKANLKDCKITKKNCTITTNYHQSKNENVNYKRCLFYFDNNKNIVPDIETKKSIDKGNNLFNYIK